MSSITAPPPVADPYSGPAEAPRLVRQRRIRRGWVGIGVLAIVLAALGSATLFRAIGPSQEYLALARDVPVGAQVTASDLRVVRLSASPGLSSVPLSEVDQVIGRYAAVPLVAGSLLTPEQLTTEPARPRRPGGGAGLPLRRGGNRDDRTRGPPWRTAIGTRSAAGTAGAAGPSGLIGY